MICLCKRALCARRVSRKTSTRLPALPRIFTYTHSRDGLNKGARFTCAQVSAEQEKRVRTRSHNRQRAHAHPRCNYRLSKAAHCSCVLISKPSAHSSEQLHVPTPVTDSIKWHTALVRKSPLRRSAGVLPSASRVQHSVGAVGEVDPPQLVIPRTICMPLMLSVLGPPLRACAIVCGVFVHAKRAERFVVCAVGWVEILMLRI